MGEEVVYVHGLWMSGGESLLLRRRLAREFGMEVHPFRYAAAGWSMGEITARLQRFVRDLSALLNRLLDLIMHWLPVRPPRPPTE